MSELIEMEKKENGKHWAMARTRFGRRAAKVGVALTAGFAAGMATAADHSAAIEGAFTDGSTNVTAAVVGVIALVAIVTGLGMIVSILRR
ncbi:hypothetical protein [Marinobacter sp. 2_MG-2023]|uniref:hypothetical protein n=1 Tax=Marinobacter sp. 2_MG-2023 TaxID=3062679 RepID=UPI0026E39BA2|nr:hypothetical protein [Marinobacter sp. 2_MG-2023]MDO6444129.1 hypothetical protein [Marinobacter sp. 2_MG-2023]